MGSSMSLEQTYKITTIVLAGFSGVLLIVLLATCCRLCRYRNKLMSGMMGGQITRKIEVHHGGLHENWGAAVQGAGRSCHCQVPGSCPKCHHYASAGSAYDWMTAQHHSGTSMVADSNPYIMAKPQGGSCQPCSEPKEHVVLNSPACTEPRYPTAEVVTSLAPPRDACSSAQFVLQSCASKY